MGDHPELAASCDRMRTLLVDVCTTAAEALKAAREAESDGERWRRLSAAIANLRSMLRPKPDTVAALLDCAAGADGVEKAPKMVREEAVCPHRYDRVDIYRLGPMDFVRQDNTDGRVTYTSLADTSGTQPQPGLYRMTIIPRDGGGRVVCIFGTFGELVGKYVATMGTRNDIECAARWLCASIVARAYHKRASQARWRANKKARMAAEAEQQGDDSKAEEPLTPEEEL